MPTKIYDSGYIRLIDNTEIYITPLKIKYLKEFMDVFQDVKASKSDDEAIEHLCMCASIAMKQFYPDIVNNLADHVDLQTIYKILELSAGIKINQKSEDPVTKQATESGSTWESLDLAQLESEVFLLGIWKDYEELEKSLSMPEILATLSAKRELDYQEKKFLAAIQGVDIDKESGKSNAWEEMKARVFSGGKTSDSNDILAYQGITANKAGFGIGLGLDYEDLT
jgi:hypothetical protein